jgi:hypothetical protein
MPPKKTGTIGGNEGKAAGCSAPATVLRVALCQPLSVWRMTWRSTTRANKNDARRYYCFGGSRDCGGETWVGLDEAWVESGAGCCTGFGTGTAGFLAGGGAEIF